MLSNYPIYFDNTELTIRRVQWSRGYDNLENVSETEAGTDEVEVIRKGKTVIGAAFNCSDRWASILSAFNDQQNIQVRFYDIKTKDYVTLKMRMEDLNIDEVQDSDRVSGTNGLYIVSFNLVEF